MTSLLLGSFLIACLGALIFIIVHPKRFLEYPSMMGCVFAGFVAPQLIILYVHPDKTPVNAFDALVLMSLLCLVSCWIGYFGRPIRIDLPKFLDSQLDYRRLAEGGLLLGIMSYIAHFQLRAEVLQNDYGTQWSGIVTIYFFFRGLIYPSMAILCMCFFKLRKVAYFLLFLISAYLPFLDVIGGRREQGAAFVIIVFLCVYYHFRYVPPRSIIALIIVSASIYVLTVGAYRSFIRNHPLSEVRLDLFVNELSDDWKEGNATELAFAGIYLEGVEQSGQLDYGVNYWNFLVHRFVPGQIVGHELKREMQVSLPEERMKLIGYLRSVYKIPVGTTITGMADSYAAFWYFGCLFFVLQGALYRQLWEASVVGNKVGNQLIYMTSITSAMRSVTHQTVDFLPGLLFNLIFLGIVLVYAQRKTLRKSGI